jgi:hypothetical protein
MAGARGACAALRPNLRPSPVRPRRGAVDLLRERRRRPAEASQPYMEVPLNTVTPANSGCLSITETLRMRRRTSLRPAPTARRDLGV